MTASSFSNETIFQRFHEQYRESKRLFDNLREQLILQVSDAIKPLVEFLEAHECSEDEILIAIFEAISFEKQAELELGAFAFDQRNEWVDQCGDEKADEQSQVLYRLGLELFRDLQRHRLYQHGFLPYQFARRHGRDVLVNRLNVPEIMHRDPTLRDMQFGKMSWKPELIVVKARTMPADMCGFAKGQAEQHADLLKARDIAARAKRLEESARQEFQQVETNKVALFEEEMRRLFSQLQNGDTTSPAAVTPPDERSVMTPDELNEWFAKMLWAKQMELKRGVAMHRNPELVNLVYRAKVLGDLEAAHQLEEHISKTIRVVEEKDEPSA